MEKMLMTWERKILREIYGPTEGNGQWRIETDSELMAKYKSQYIVSAIKIRRLEWLGHVTRMNFLKIYLPKLAIREYTTFSL
jgi:hypothetical protein